MKYYIYISTAKLDILFPQIPRPFWEKVSLKLKIKSEYGEAEVGLREDQRSRIDMLDRTIRYMEKKRLIGEVGSGKPYIRAQLNMRWMDMYGVIYWTGYHMRRMNSKSQTLVGLGGSTKHLIGLSEGDKSLQTSRIMDNRESRPTVGSMGSYTDTILNSIRNPIARDPSVNAPSLNQYCDYEMQSNSSVSVMAITADWMFGDHYGCGPTREVEFVAKTLFSSSYTPMIKVVLATPIYVSHV